MTIRSRECEKGILDDALEIFNIVGICLEIYEIKLKMSENSKIWNFYYFG